MKARYLVQVLSEPTATGAQITQKAQPQPSVERLFLPICCLCKRIRDRSDRPVDHVRWITQRTFRKLHGVRSVDCLFTHTYCPECLSQVMTAIPAKAMP